MARPRRGDHAPFWLAPLRVPSALAAREAGFGAQPGAGGANHRRPSRRGRRVGEAGRPRPGSALGSRGPRDPGQPRAGSQAQCQRVGPPPPPPAMIPGSPGSVAAPDRLTARGRAAGPWPPGSESPGFKDPDRRELPCCCQHLRKLVEKFEKEKSNLLSAPALPMTLQPREAVGNVHISERPPRATPVLSSCICSDSRAYANFPGFTDLPGLLRSHRPALTLQLQPTLPRSTLT